LVLHPFDMSIPSYFGGFYKFCNICPLQDIILSPCSFLFSSCLLILWVHIFPLQFSSVQVITAHISCAYRRVQEY
jgi:hypothetical protein